MRNSLVFKVCPAGSVLVVNSFFFSPLIGVASNNHVFTKFYTFAKLASSLLIEFSKLFNGSLLKQI